MIAQVKVNDDSWIPDYAAKVHDIVHKHDGKYLARSGRISAIEGSPPDVNLVAVIEFPSEEAMNSFVNDPDYAPFAASRQAGTDSVMFSVDDKDAAGTIPYLL